MTSMSSNISTFKKITRAFSTYLLDTPQQHPSLVAYTRYSLPCKYKYERPALLELDEEATTASADHEIRPVMHPKRPLLMKAGYAEVINAGKTPKVNEDQSRNCSFVVTVPTHLRNENWKREDCQIPVIYFSVFDGHAGTGAALFAYHRLHVLIKERLTQISHMLIMPQEEIEKRYFATGLITSINAEKLIMGALEESFQAMDDEIKRERLDYRVDGGCTAIAAIFIKGKLYVGGAGDSRAVVYCKNDVIPMSRDHSPESERKRIQTLAMYKPALLHDEYTRFQFQHRCRKKDIGTRQLYRDHMMDGWGFKLIEKNDLKPQVICGEGKRSRLLDTIGTTRGFGDHDLEVPCTNGLKVKPFMSAAPEIFVFDLQSESLEENDVLVIATDGLWEKLTNEKIGDILMHKFAEQKSDDSRRYIVGAQCLVDAARGSLSERGWRMCNNDVATYDDVSVFVVPLKEWSNTLHEVLKHHRERTTPSLSSNNSLDDYCKIPDVNSKQQQQQHNLAIVNDVLSPAELSTVTKSYDNIQSVRLKGMEQLQKQKLEKKPKMEDEVGSTKTKSSNVECDINTKLEKELKSI